jgi:hypothetical protein
MATSSIKEAEEQSVTKGAYGYLFGFDNKKKMNSAYHEEIETIGWVGLTPVPLLATHSKAGNTNGKIGNKTIAIYKQPEESYDLLQATVMLIKTPTMELRNEKAIQDNYRFRFVKDFGYKVATNAEFRTKEKLIQQLDTYSQIVLHQKMTKAGHMKAADECIGNTDKLQTWSTIIYADEIYPRQKFYYSLWPGKAFKLYRLSSPNDVYHKYELCLDINKLIEMQQFNNTTMKWENIAVDMKLFKKGTTSELELPTMYGMFGSNSDVEIQEHLENSTEGSDTFLIYDMIKCDPIDNTKYRRGMTAVTDQIKTCTGVVQAIFWSAENVSHTHLNHTCNYAIESTGKSIISLNTLKIRGGEKFSDLPSALLETPLSMDHCSSSLGCRGIMSHFYVQEIERGNNGGSCPQSLDPTLSCLISDDFPENDECVFRVRVLITKKMTIRGGIVSIDPN